MIGRPLQVSGIISMWLAKLIIFDIRIALNILIRFHQGKPEIGHQIFYKLPSYIKINAISMTLCNLV
ncbi:hypothetical protein D9M68_862350 [compost metagenome]